MTDEQIIQNAERHIMELGVQGESRYFEMNGYVSGAHSRDREIMDLEHLLKTERTTNKVLAEANEKLRNPWISVEDDKLPKEGQDVLICNFAGRIIRIENVGLGDINYMKDNPELYKSWMPTPKCLN